MSEAAAYALLELRRVGAAACALVSDWLSARVGDGPPAVTPVPLVDCHGQLRAITGPVLGVDDVGPQSWAEEELALRRVIQSRAATSPTPTPLEVLKRDAGLDAAELDLLLLAALAEESSLWGSLFAWLSGQPQVRRPTVHAVLNLWASNLAQRTRLHGALIEGALARHDLVRLLPADAPLADRMLCLAESLWPSLLGLNAIDPVLLASVEREPLAPAEPILADHVRARATALRDLFRAGRSRRAVLTGAVGVGRRTVARWIAAESRLRLVELKLPEGVPPREWTQAAVRHALVRDAALLLTAQSTPGEPVIVELALPPSMPCFLVLPERADVRGSTFASADRLQLEPPTAIERSSLWQLALARHGLNSLDPRELARRHRTTAADIDAAVTGALRLAQVDRRDHPTDADVAQAVRARPALKLEALARRRAPAVTFADLVLPDNQAGQLHELTERVRHRDQVFQEWGLGARGGRQTGVLALFVGASGTGKTLGAEVVAGELGLDLYCVDLSQVVSKYIGETEKNLSRVFDAVDNTAAILFFDEADGLFGRRTETRDAHDRYANLELSYLLARLETFDGVAILASNLRQNIDGAFMRRMDFVVEFPQPDAAARRRLWERHLRCGAPIAHDLDLARLAEAFPVSGAHIRNAVVAAAFGAAADAAPLGAMHLAAAMRREYEKLGKAFPSSPLGEEPRRPL